MIWGLRWAAASKDERNNRAVVSLLRDLPEALDADGGLTLDNRGARFVCALALAKDGEVVLRAEGEVEGQILEEPRGTDGFGYDPLFLVPGLGKTLAEMSGEEKWAVSHRGNAFRELLRQLVGVRKSRSFAYGQDDRKKSNSKLRVASSANARHHHPVAMKPRRGWGTRGR